MSNSVVAAAAASRAKHLVPSKKIKKHPEDQRPAQDERQDADHDPKTAHVVQAEGAHASEKSMSGEFSFSAALAGAAADNASLSFAQDGGSGSSDDGSSGGGTLLAIGAVGLVGAGVAVLASGGGKNDTNAAPTVSAATQAITIAEDSGPKAITVSASDADGDALTYTVPTSGTGAPTKGTVTVGANGALTYTPTLNANGTDSFVVTVKDPSGASVTQTVNITITPENDAPTVSAATQAITTDNGAAKTFAVSASDVDGDALTYTVPASGTGSPAKGAVTVGANGSLTYTPIAGASGTDTFVVTVKDPGGLSATQTVTVTLTSSNLPPVAGAENDNSITLNEDTPKAFVIDYDDPDGSSAALVVSVVTQPAHGSLSFVNGQNLYTPTLNYNGTDSFTYRVTDSAGGFTDHTVAVTISPVNDAPIVAAPIADQALAQAGAFSFTVPAGTFTDVDDTTLTYTATLGSGSALPSWLAFNAATHQFTGTAPADFTGTLDIKVTATDAGALSASDTFVLTVGNGPTNTSIDVGNPFGNSNPETVSAASGAFNFVDDGSKNTFVVINGFGADDKITFTNVADANTLNYGVSTDGQDLLIDWQNTATSTAEKIVLADVFANLQTAPFVSTYAEAVAALGGHNFITIA